MLKKGWKLVGSLLILKKSWDSLVVVAQVDSIFDVPPPFSNHFIPICLIPKVDSNCLILKKSQFQDLCFWAALPVPQPHRDLLAGRRSDPGLGHLRLSPRKLGHLKRYKL